MVASTRFKFWPPPGHLFLSFRVPPDMPNHMLLPAHTGFIACDSSGSSRPPCPVCLSPTHLPVPVQKSPSLGELPTPICYLNRQTQLILLWLPIIIFFLAITLFLTCLGRQSAVSVPVSFLRQKALEGWVKWWILCLLHSISHKWKCRTTNLPQ